MSVIYRGFDIEHTAEGWVVSEGGMVRYNAKSENDAMAWVDSEKRRMTQGDRGQK